MPRPSVKFGISFPNFSLEASSQISRDVERAKLDSVWVNDDLVGVFQKETFDPFLCMAEMSRATRKVSIGSAVLATYRKHPVNTALSLISLDHLSGGRIVAGVGSCCPSPEWGFPATKDVAERFLEFASLLKKLLRGGEVKFKAKYFSVNTSGLPVKPRQRPHPPIWAAANLDRTIRAIAEVADGWLPICVPPKIYSSEAETLNATAERAGRKPREIVKGCMAFIVVSKRRGEAVKKAIPLLAQTALWFGSARTRKMGFTGISSVSDVPPEVVRELNIVGSIEDAAQRIGEYIDAGVEHLVFQPLPVREIRETIPRIVEAIKQAA
ncbi:MAG: LLM class flavin-dependent oxidoreductase [Nitrososphaerota archaeon]|nr:LLM class flavin-dependent oxidoreductase [Candidatus Calditenuaceae archaeon]MDW8073198.1 LLM class flavin-dependent oxidoreductase [Nitrososphaerota archaeon]